MRQNGHILLKPKGPFCQQPSGLWLLQPAGNAGCGLAPADAPGQPQHTHAAGQQKQDSCHPPLGLVSSSYSLSHLQQAQHTSATSHQRCTPGPSHQHCGPHGAPTLTRTHDTWATARRPGLHRTSSRSTCGCSRRHTWLGDPAATSCGMHPTILPTPSAGRRGGSRRLTGSRAPDCRTRGRAPRRSAARSQHPAT